MGGNIYVKEFIILPTLNKICLYQTGRCHPWKNFEVWDINSIEFPSNWVKTCWIASNSKFLNQKLHTAQIFNIISKFPLCIYFSKTCLRYLYFYFAFLHELPIWVSINWLSKGQCLFPLFDLWQRVLKCNWL